MTQSRLQRIAPLLALGLTVTAAHADSGWPTFRDGWLNSGRTAHLLGAANAGDQTSRQELGGLIWATPVLDEQGNVYVGSSNKRFFALAPDGSMKWSSTLFDRPDSLIDSAAALVPGGQVVVPGGDGDLHAFDVSTGRALWDFHAYGVSDSSHQSGVQVNSFEGNVQVGPNGWIYAGSDNGTLYCLDSSGKEKWHFLTGMMVWSSPAFSSAGDWLAFGSLDGHVYLLNPQTGALLASLNVGSDVKASIATDGRDQLYFGASDGKFRAVKVLKQQSGNYSLQLEWDFKTRLEVYSSAALGDGTVYFGSMDGHIYALDTRTGKLRWDYATYSPVASSPLLTADAALVTGAANGKLYALDANEGKRLWSYQTSPATSQKANLDSSPSLDVNGYLWVGSYQGALHRVGARHCPLHPEDPRCEFGGNADTPDFGATSIPEQGAFLRYEDSQGRFGAQASTLVGRAQPLHLRLAVYRAGAFENMAAISVAGLNVTASRDGAALPSGELTWSVSSDGKWLNIQPVGFFKGGSHYTVQIRGQYYGQSDWLTDRLQWLTLHSFEDHFEFDTETEKPSPLATGSSAGWYLHSLYLTQPKAMDTYVPAALDGQAFIVKPFALEPGNSHFLLAVLPALPSENGFQLLAEPARATAIQAEFSGDSLRGQGAFRISAMGGEIPFKDFELMSGLDEKGNLRDGQLRAVASCLGMQGNGSTYHFPWALVDQVCDPYLRMIAYLVFRSDLLPVVSEAPIQAALTKAEGGEWQARFTASSGSTLPPGDLLLTAVVYDAATTTILARQFEKITIAVDQKETQATLKGLAKGLAGQVHGGKWVVQFFLGSRAVTPVGSVN